MLAKETLQDTLLVLYFPPSSRIKNACAVSLLGGKVDQEEREFVSNGRSREWNVSVEKGRVALALRGGFLL